jgi:methylmalonyl-CoA mutase N-terminal domain/subunit
MSPSHASGDCRYGRSPAPLNDLLKKYIARGTYIYPPARRCARPTCSPGAAEPQWNTISISGYHIREAGSTAAQERRSRSPTD